jgi:hypothetical protein
LFPRLEAGDGPGHGSGKWSFRTLDAGGSAGSKSITFPNAKTKFNFNTYDGRGDTSGEDFYTGATMS